MPASPTARADVPVEQIKVSAYRVPTDLPESDGTLSWDATTVVTVEITAGGRTGLGFTYANTATAWVIRDTLADVVLGRDAMAVPQSWQAMVRAVRNLSRQGVSSMAIAAVDVGLWDLKARLLDLPLVTLLGQVRGGIPVYGSGGFTSYSTEQLRQQLAGWAESGFRMVKMKVGRDPDADLERARVARAAIGPDVELFVDANGAYSRKQALAFAEAYAAIGVVWFEEPVPSDDLDGLRLMRDRAPAGMDIAAGEYGYDLGYFRRMLEAGAVDVLQADGSRCAGITGFLRVSPLVESRQMALSAHTAPSLHLAPCCALPTTVNIEYFHDHARVDRILFDGVVDPVAGMLYPDLSRPGHGLELKQADAARYQI